MSRLADTEDQIIEIDERLTPLQEARDAGSQLTPAQQRQLTQLTERREKAQREVDRINALLDG